MINIRCVICKNNQKLRELYPETIKKNRITGEVFSARRQPDRIHYRMVRCLRCGLIFSNPILEPEKITSLYKKSTFNYKTESDYLKKTYGNYLRKALENKELHKISLLDLGCGNGFFLEEAQEMGIKDVWGVEPGKSTVNKTNPKLKNKIKVDILRHGLFKRKKFDVITCFHTLDHIVDPSLFLSVTRNLLKKGGMALFIVHDTQGLSVRLLGESSPIYDIEHIFLFNKKTLAKIFEINGFKTNEVFEVRNSYPLNYWTRMFPLNPTIKQTLLKFLKMVHLDTFKVSIQAGNIGIVASK